MESCDQEPHSREEGAGDQGTTWHLNLVGAVVHLLACDGFWCVVLAATMNVRGVIQDMLHFAVCQLVLVPFHEFSQWRCPVVVMDDTSLGAWGGVVHLLASEEHLDTDVRSHDACDKFSFLMFYLASALLLERLGVEGYGSQTSPISFNMVLGTLPDVGAELQFVACFCAMVSYVGTVS